MKTATPTDTCDLIIGSGAFSYSWYEDTRDTHFYEPGGIDKAFDDWHCSLVMEDPEEGGDTILATLNHKEVMKWARHVIKNKGKLITYGKHGATRLAWSGALETACTALVFDVGECDFDATTADELVQLIAYGEVIFG